MVLGQRQEVCEHEGFTAFHCDVTQVIKPARNFVVTAVDNTRREDNVPALETDWWNYGGLTRVVSFIEFPEASIDQYDLHLSRLHSLVDGHEQPSMKYHAYHRNLADRARSLDSTRLITRHCWFAPMATPRSWTIRSAKLSMLLA